uniref:Uncharacterized protein n=1 Tax=Knipowitschia caucasica TaxID=637954 RepID=A0AAV2JQL4_KNICA
MTQIVLLHFRHNNPHSPLQERSEPPRSSLLHARASALSLAMADGEKSPLLSDLGDGALGGGSEGSGLNKPQMREHLSVSTNQSQRAGGGT